MSKTFLKVPFYNKGIEMIKLSQIVHSKPVKKQNKTIPSFINETPLR